MGAYTILNFITWIICGLLIGYGVTEKENYSYGVTIKRIALTTGVLIFIIWNCIVGFGMNLKNILNILL